MLSTFEVVPSSLARRRGRCRAGGARGVSAPCGAAPARRASRGRRVANMAHTRQSRPDSGLDSQVIKVLTTFKVSPPRPRAGVGAAGLGALGAGGVAHLESTSFIAHPLQHPLNDLKSHPDECV